jgi:hypothetical protein
MKEETRELALNGTMTDALLLVEQLKEEVEGARRRNLITDELKERGSRPSAD